MACFLPFAFVFLLALRLYYVRVARGWQKHPLQLRDFPTPCVLCKPRLAHRRCGHGKWKSLSPSSPDHPRAPALGAANLAELTGLVLGRGHLVIRGLVFAAAYLDGR